MQTQKKPHYIERERHSYLKRRLTQGSTGGVILSGIVGCGKTTLIENILSELSEEYRIFKYSGDDVAFRKAVLDNSSFIKDEIKSSTHSKPIIFVDEVQKTEHIFDAIKVAYDELKVRFIISGSNPEFLSSTAKKRLQRRAEQVELGPLSLSEIFSSENIVDLHDPRLFDEILFHDKHPENLKLNKKYSISERIEKVIRSYLKYGGLPIAYLTKNPEDKLIHLKNIVERGFELFKNENEDLAERIRLELALLHSKEFSFQNIMNKARIRKRDPINDGINDLINHGYLCKKKPILLSNEKTSYLSVYSYIDPGIVTYLNGDPGDEIEQGFRLEGYIHSLLHFKIKNSAIKSEYGYYKPHQTEASGKIKFKSGEIDFIFKRHRTIIPIEVKLNSNIGNINTTLIKEFMDYYKVDFGIIIYGGVPFWDRKTKLLYWPYWLI